MISFFFCFCLLIWVTLLYYVVRVAAVLSNEGCFDISGGEGDVAMSSEVGLGREDGCVV